MKIMIKNVMRYNEDRLSKNKKPCKVEFLPNRSHIFPNKAELVLLVLDKRYKYKNILFYRYLQ